MREMRASRLSCMIFLFLIQIPGRSFNSASLADKGCQLITLVEKGREYFENECL